MAAPRARGQDAVGDDDIRRIDTPVRRRGTHQHIARRGAGRAILHEGVGDCRRSAGTLHSPEQVLVLIGIGRRKLGLDRAPVRVEFHVVVLFLGLDGVGAGLQLLRARGGDFRQCHAE